MRDKINKIPQQTQGHESEVFHQYIPIYLYIHRRSMSICLKPLDLIIPDATLANQATHLLLWHYGSGDPRATSQNPRSLGVELEWIVVLLDARIHGQKQKKGPREGLFGNSRISWEVKKERFKVKQILSFDTNNKITNKSHKATSTAISLSKHAMLWKPVTNPRKTQNLHFFKAKVLAIHGNSRIIKPWPTLLRFTCLEVVGWWNRAWRIGIIRKVWKALVTNVLPILDGFQKYEPKWKSSPNRCK